MKKLLKDLQLVLTRCCVLVLLFLTSVAVGLAQQESGQISGIVKDQNGAVIAGATITVKNVDTNAERTTTSNEEGFYVVTNLQTGVYDVTATAQGFQPITERAQVTVGAKLTVNLQAGVKAVEVGTVEITSGGVAEVNTTDQQISNTVTEQQLQSLPLLDRNPYAAVQLAGNVSNAGPSMAVARGAGFQINGQRAASTNILLDGTENADTFTTGVSLTTPLDSVSEFRIISSNFSAEYGRATGGIVNVATKPGTNRFTGSIFAFNRNSALASNDYDNSSSGIKRPVFNRNQFGYSVAGPIFKNKLFFSNSTEWTRIRSTNSVFAWVPSAALIASSAPNTRAFFNTFGQLKARPTGQFDSGFQRVVYDAPNDAGGGIPSDNYSTVTRIDWNLSDKTQIYGRYAIQKNDFFQGTVFNSPYTGYDAGQTIFNQNAQVSIFHQFSANFVSSTKLAFRRSTTLNTLGDKAPDTPTLYFFPNLTAVIDTDPIGLPGYIPFNPGAGFNTDGPENLGQLNQDISYTKGNHVFKFGGQYVYIQDNRTFGAFQNASETLGPNGDFEAAVDNLISGQLFQFQVAVDPQGKFPGQQVTLPVKSPNFSRSNRYNEFALYGNDSWRIHPRFTLNLGLRYEYYGPQKSKEGQDSNFYFGPGSNIFERIRNGGVKDANTAGGLWKADKNNFAPRIGFAWDVFGDGKTSIRGGYGVAYERNFGNVTFNVIQNPPFYAVLSVFGSEFPAGLPITTNNFGPLGGTGAPRTLPRTSLRHVREDIVNAYAHLWSLSIEREIARNTVAKLDYSGSAGRKLYSIENINRAGTGTRYLGSRSGGGLCDNLTPATSNRLNCQYSNVNTRANNGFSDYHSLTASLESRNLFDLGLAMTARYTYAVAKDNLSSTFSESGNNFNLGLTDPFNPSLDYGYADFDIRHRFVGSFVWDLPFGKNLSSGWAKNVLGGWSINSIVTIQGGAPLTVFDCSNVNTTCIRLVPTGPLSFNAPGQLVSTPDGAPNSFVWNDLRNQTPSDFTDGFSGGTEVGFPAGMTPRNAFRGPGFWNVDTGVYKSLNLTERYKLQFRADFLNVFNHPNLLIVGQSAEVNNGIVTATKAGRRTGQLSVKFLF